MNQARLSIDTGIATPLASKPPLPDPLHIVGDEVGGVGLGAIGQQQRLRRATALTGQRAGEAVIDHQQAADLATGQTGEQGLLARAAVDLQRG
ncbi:hypothetical protein ACPDZI_23640 [Aeromonas oralensis]|uniref:hypothetical protein n=1 Tax=Aeromonas oralensis TaxID=3415010 RepID=UPI003F691BA9